MEKVPVAFLIPESMVDPAVDKKTAARSKFVIFAVQHGGAFPLKDETEFPAVMGTGS